MYLYEIVNCGLCVYQKKYITIEKLISELIKILKNKLREWRSYNYKYKNNKYTKLKKLYLNFLMKNYDKICTKNYIKNVNYWEKKIEFKNAFID